MTAPQLTTDRQRELIAQLKEFVTQRGQEEVALRQQNVAQIAQARADFQQRREQITAGFEAQHPSLVSTYKKKREAVFFKTETDGAAVAVEDKSFHEEAEQEHSEFLDDAKQTWQFRRQSALDSFRENEVIPKQEFAQFKQGCEARLIEIQAIVQEAKALVESRCPWPTEFPPAEPLTVPKGLSKPEYLERVHLAMARAREVIVALHLQRYARFLQDGWPVLIFIFVGVGSVYPIYLLALQNYPLVWSILAGFVTGVLTALIVRQIILPISIRQTLQVLPAFMQQIEQANLALNATVQAAKLEAEQAQRKLAEKREHELARADKEYDTTQHQQQARHIMRLKKAAEKFARRRQDIQLSHGEQVAQVEEQFPPQIRQVEQRFEQQIAALTESYQETRTTNRSDFEQAWQELVARWQAGLAEFERAVGEMNAYCAAHFPAWNSVDWKKWTPNQAAEGAGISALRFGHFDFDLAKMADLLPPQAQLEVPPQAYQLPAVLSFPECPSLLLEAEGDGREVATQGMQDVMLRLLTSFPPGKVRFTIIDPVGLGQNFSAFMHLADYDEKLVNNRIWTESNHVTQRLADLTEHMENVIQKYLRNEFASIQEYNIYAEEVAEPFQILVVANFPANFSDEAARRLVSIASSGARCGVYTLISTDSKLALPRNFDLADLEAQAATLVWNQGDRRFAWKQPELTSLPLTLDTPPDDQRFTDIVCNVGQLAKSGNRVEVPFESIIPADPQWWAADSRGEIEVPLGRAGAKKFQYMRLGKGTSQHVLISGKTGSGKSTLLNAMITSLAIHYSPDELQFYLIDFKKGVEFKAFATFRLPHAKVIAIESEREFGMSVLERLDLELKNRGDLFRKEGVQDVKGYRNANPTAIMPRILLVIDEFQEFFTSDDKISHDSALLLDRLVRQGRAFGIHVLLGSQTLAGAYSLARSTLGQMAVRIALQCSEADAHLILSEDNTAARLLSRPGEAIYNDANGMFEGNHPFQVVWLPDHQREIYLRRMAAMSTERNMAAEAPTVFEGNVAADPADNLLLKEALQAPAPAVASASLAAWLGAAVAIKDPTAFNFRRQGGSNLLIVGQQEERSLGILANCLVSLSAQLNSQPPGGADRLHRFYVLDGTRPESPEIGFWERMQNRVALDAKICKTREAGEVIRRLAAEVDRRLSAGDLAAEPIFVCIYNLSRFRDLKKSDDFGLSGFGEDGGAVSAGKQLTTILREGPALGIHTLIWCDSYANLNRWVDRQTMRDFEMRVLFQMSNTDSSNLMDSPVASRLGVQMAIAYSEEQGHFEKFRPYGLPTNDWLAWVAQQLGERKANEAPVVLPVVLNP